VAITAMVWGVSARAAAPVSPLDGHTIRSIEFVRDNIFDTANPATSSWPYRAANSLHIVTRERFLRSMLLFEEGDPYSADQAAESARILRSLSFMNPVEITATSVADDEVVVRVHTHDKWTLKVGAQLGIFGNRTKTGANFTETNFLGRGRRVDIEYQNDNERASWRYALYDPNVLGSRWRAKIRHEDASDGQVDELTIDRPFYSLDTAATWGGQWKKERLDAHIYSGGDTVIRGRQRDESWLLWGGHRLDTGGDEVHRILAGWDYQSADFSDWRFENGSGPVPNPENRLISGPRLAYQRRADSFAVLHGFRGWSVQEDLSLATEIDLGMTVSASVFGGDRRRLVIDGTISRAWQYDRWVLLTSAWESGRIESSGIANLVVGCEIAMSQLGPRGWQARLRAETSDNLDRELQLSLGADTGLRGWDPDTFDGTGRVVGNIQWRTLLKEDFLHLFSLGIVGFVDVGHTWGARYGPGTDGPRGDIGVGMLVDLTHIGLANLMRFEIALPDDGSGPTVTVTSEALF
jgi:hypothetical protein